MKITISLAGIPIELDMTYSDYLPIYEKYITDESPVSTVSISKQEISKALECCEEYQEPADVERVELCPKISNVLLEHNRVFFHGTAFVWKEKAWIFTAPPGTGKTTQYVLWKHKYGDEVELLNGDKPILECADDGITVHHSPWRGKENMGQEISAPLGGIILLEQANENRIERFEKDAIIPIFKQFMYNIDCESVKKVFEIEDKMLRNVPVFKLYNLGDEASIRLCHDTLEDVIK